MRQPTPDILAPAAPDIIDAVFGAAAANDRPGATTWHKRTIDYPVDRVRVGKRMRPQRDVSALAASMADPQVGLINAITLLPDGSLVAGRHRLAAAKLLGWKTIPAVIMELGELDAELVEIDENLRRSELTVLEEAQHQARRDEILRAKGLRAQASSGQNQHTNGASPVGAPGAPTITTAQMAAQIGMSERAAQERMQIARGITPLVQELIAEHPVANSTKGLLALARLDSAVQTAVARMLIDRRAESVTDAMGILEQEAAQRAQQLQDEQRGAVKSAEGGSRQQGAALGKCRICKRPLTDPAHAAAGIGPCCASKAASAGSATEGGEEQTEAPAVPVSQRDGYDSDEWYTPVVYIEAARLVLGEIELDPASCSLANTVVKAARYIDKAHDGLRLPWCTGGLWLNPPYSATQEWVDKLIEEFDEERTDAAIILVNNATETRWFQALLRRFPVCFPASRLQFWRHDHENVGARQGQALFLLTRDRAQMGNFTAAFGQFGPVLWVK
jgi:ParB-like chromosome segregation protein Spo0J